MSSCGPEAQYPTTLFHGSTYRLPSSAFRWWLLARIHFPVHPGRTVCPYCNAPADESIIHNLGCFPDGYPSGHVTRRHKNVQSAMLEQIQAVKDDDVEIFNGVPRYVEDMHFTPKPRAADANGEKRIVMGDIGVTLKRGAVNGQGHLYAVDIVITGPNRVNLTPGVFDTVGGMAKVAEERKRTEIARNYVNLTPAQNARFIPMALEVTGTFGQEGRNFLVKFLPGPPPPDNAPAQLKSEFNSDRNRRLGKIKSAMVMAVLRTNADIFDAFASRPSTMGETTPGPPTG